jgi:hypothetical protein
VLCIVSILCRFVPVINQNELKTVNFKKIGQFEMLPLSGVV